MINRINPNRLLHVESIQFEDGQTLTDKIVFVTDNFLIVADNPDDTAPTWYNVRTVDSLEGVSVAQAQTRPKEQTSPQGATWIF